MAETKVKIKLQGHEKFPLREGWLNKGLLSVEKNPRIFSDQNGTDILGVGSNMVKSIKYWMKAFGLIEDKAGTGAVITPTGRIIKQNDVYFENIFTLWVLHSNIAKNVTEATTWYMYFNKCNIEEFTKEEITKFLSREISKYVNGAAFSENSLKSDIDILLNMYGKTSVKGMDPEEKINSPLSQLGLIRSSYDTFIKGQPDRRKISMWNVLYELTYIMQGQESVSIDDIAVGNNSISSIYQISRVLINELLDELDAKGYIHVNRTAGLDIVYKGEYFPDSSVAVLKNFYKKH